MSAHRSPAPAQPSVAWQFGAYLIDARHARFRIWAPDASRLALDVEGAQLQPMRPEAQGWFALETTCSAGARYCYVLEDGTRVPDPAARAQEADVHGRSVLVDAQAYQWRHADWRGRPWHETVLYELHVGLYGGFAGVATALPELAALGVTAIELMPIADFPGPRNWGYDGVLPFAPDASYGAPDALKALVDAAHGLGLMVFLDVVYNHFGPEGNYLGHYARGFFRDDLATPWGAALDFRRPEVKTFFTENVLYWLTEFRLDGLRLDAVHAIADDGWLAGLPAAVARVCGKDRHVHLVVENDDNSAALLEAGYAAQWNDDAHHALHVLLTGETDGYYADYADRPAEHLVRCLSEGFAYQGEPSDHRGGAPRGTRSAHLSPLRFIAFLQNHDQVGNRALGERLATLARPAALRAATALLLLAPWIPMLFMGEESGEPTPFFYFTSYEGDLARAVCEGRRSEFARFAAFASERAQAQIPDPNQASTFLRSRPGTARCAPGSSRGAERAALREDESAGEFRAFVSALLAARRTYQAQLADVRASGARTLGPAALRAHWRLKDGMELSIYVNLASTPVFGAMTPSGSDQESGRRVVFETAAGTVQSVEEGKLPGESALCILCGAPPETGTRGPAADTPAGAPAGPPAGPPAGTLDDTPGASAPTPPTERRFRDPSRNRPACCTR